MSLVNKRPCQRYLVSRAIARLSPCVQVCEGIRDPFEEKKRTKRKVCAVGRHNGSLGLKRQPGMQPLYRRGSKGNRQQLTSRTSWVMGMAEGMSGRLPCSSVVRNSILLSSSHSAYDPMSRYLQTARANRESEKLTKTRQQRQDKAFPYSAHEMTTPVSSKQCMNRYRFREFRDQRQGKALP